MGGDSPIANVAGWPEVSLAEITTKIGSGATPRGGSETYLDSRIEYALIRSQNVFDRRFDRDGLAYITNEQADGLRGVVLQRSDVLLNITGDGVTFGRSCIVPEDVRPACVNQHVSIIRVDPEKADAGYVLSYLTHPDVKPYIESFNAGGSRRAITKGHIESFRLPLPPLADQRTIARILGALDDKIESNRKMNATLEAMARALFKSWFVQEPEADWKTAPLAEWVDVLSGGTPSKSNATLWGGPLKWISPKAMTSIHADECDDHVSEHAVGNGTRIAPNGSTLVMVRGMGLHDGVRVSQAREAVTFNQDVKALVPKNVEADLLLFAMLDAQEELHRRVETSGHGTGKMPSEILLSHPITMPSREVQRERAVHISALNDRIGANRSESRSLARIRDELLPRLLSGAIAVSTLADGVGEP